MSKEEGKDRDIVNNFFAFQTQRKITNLYKQFFFILEDLQASGVKIPEEQHQRIRKRILDLGWSPKISLESGLSNTIKWYKKNYL